MFLQNLQRELPYDPVIPFLGNYSKGRKILRVTDTCTSVGLLLMATSMLWFVSCASVCTGNKVLKFERRNHLGAMGRETRLV